MKDKFLSADIFRVNSSASSPRIRADPPVSKQTPPNVRRTFGGVRRKIILGEVHRIRAEPANRAESARFRGDLHGTAAEGLRPSQ